MKHGRLFAIVGLTVLVATLAAWSFRPGSFWRLASPGPLSASHSFLESNCAACHTSLTGAEANKCISCHADNTAVLQRQPTAFHASIRECSECHIEHRGRQTRPTGMNHEALARIGLREIRKDAGTDKNKNRELERLVAWMKESKLQAGVDHHGSIVKPVEAILDCATCHSTKDRHFGLFGQDCAQCHEAARWSVTGFLHPSSRSRDCVQCHQAPPSHYHCCFSMHFKQVARVEHAEVSQCYLCHQTTSWNDIKGVGFYKHH